MRYINASHYYYYYYYRYLKYLIQTAKTFFFHISECRNCKRKRKIKVCGIWTDKQLFWLISLRLTPVQCHLLPSNSIFLLLLPYLSGLIPGKIFPEDAVGRRFSIEANAGEIPDTDDTSDVIPGDSGERSFAAMHCGNWPRKILKIAKFWAQKSWPMLKDFW